jgi:hypothetical protein
MLTWKFVDDPFEVKGRELWVALAISSPERTALSDGDPSAGEGP